MIALTVGSRDLREPLIDPTRLGDIIRPVPAARSDSKRGSRFFRFASPTHRHAPNKDAASEAILWRAPMSSDDKLIIETPEQTALEFPLAGIGSRSLALVIDTLLQFGAVIVLGLLAWLISFVAYM